MCMSVTKYFGKAVLYLPTYCIQGNYPTLPPHLVMPLSDYASSEIDSSSTILRATLLRSLWS